MKKRYLLLFIVLICLGCAKKEDEKYIGEWSNNIEGRDNGLTLLIKKDGDKLLVRTIIETKEGKGGTLYLRSAVVDKDGYLITEGGGLFEKMSYSETENALLIVNSGMYIPSFHRVK